MEYELIPALKDTILNPIENDMGDTIIDIAELGLDSVLQEGVLREVPIFGTIFSLCKTGVNIKERHLIRKTAKFITAFNQSELSNEQIEAYKVEFEKNPQKAEKKSVAIKIMTRCQTAVMELCLLYGRRNSEYLPR
jgi:hypothetical protein